jgi:hypothetical protein
VVVKEGDNILLQEAMTKLMHDWEDLNYRLECRQMNSACAEAEHESVFKREKPTVLDWLNGYELPEILTVDRPLEANGEYRILLVC